MTIKKTYIHEHIQTDRQTHTTIGGRTDIQTDRRMDGLTNTDQQADRPTYKQTDRWTDRQTGRRTDTNELNLTCRKMRKSNLFAKKLFKQNIYYILSTDWIQIKTDVLSILFRVYTVCKGYPQTTSRKELHCKKRMTNIPGVASSIPAPSHTFAEIDHEIISTAILPPLALIQEGLLSVTR